MKAVHTYSHRNGKIWKEIFYHQWLSAIWAKKNYGYISLFGDHEVLKHCRELGLPYDEFVDSKTKAGEFKTFSVPKLFSYLRFDEEVLHLDTDTIIFDKIDFRKFDQKVLFNSPDSEFDLDYRANYFETFSEVLQLSTYDDFDNIYDKFPNGHSVNMFRTYAHLFNKIGRHLPEEMRLQFDIRDIPNMNTVYVKDHKSFRKAVVFALDHYNKFREVIDSYFYGACYIEQLIIHLHLKTYCEEYNLACRNKQIYLFEENPVGLNSPVWEHDINKWQFPIEFSSLKLREDGSCKKEYVPIKTKRELNKVMGYTFNGFNHLGPMKGMDIMQAWVIDHLVGAVGPEHVAWASKRFYWQDASPGELLYEKLTGDKIFSNG